MHCYNIHAICTMFTLRVLYLEVSDTAEHPYDPWSVETPPVHPPYILDLQWVWADCGKDFHPPPKPSENTCPYHRDCACEWKEIVRKRLSLLVHITLKGKMKWEKVVTSLWIACRFSQSRPVFAIPYYWPCQETHRASSTQILSRD